MKRTALVFIVILLISASAFGCAGTVDPNAQEGESPNKEYCFDYRIRTMMAGGANQIIETDDTVYFLLRGFLYFSDKENKDFLPLCPRPDCDHNNFDCSAYIDGSNLTVLGSYIYYVDGMHDAESIAAVQRPSLRRMRLDGTAHEKLMDLPFPETAFIPNQTRCSTVFTNRYAVAFSGAISDDDYAYGGYIIDLVSLETKQISMPWVDFEYPGGLIAVAGRGDYLYCLINDNTYLFKDGKVTCWLCILDCRTGELSRIGELPQDVLTGEFSFCLTDDSLYYMWWLPGQDRRLYKCELDSGISEQIASGAYDESNWNQLDWQNGLLFKDYRGENEEMPKGIYYTGLDLKTLDFHPYSDEELTEIEYITFFFQTESYIFGIGPDKSGAYSAQNCVPEWYIDKADIGTGNLMWKRWAPEE